CFTTPLRFMPLTACRTMAGSVGCGKCRRTSVPPVKSSAKCTCWTARKPRETSTANTDITPTMFRNRMKSITLSRTTAFIPCSSNIHGAKFVEFAPTVNQIGLHTCHHDGREHRRHNTDRQGHRKTADRTRTYDVQDQSNNQCG